MKKTPLVHFIEWKKIPDERLDSAIATLSSIGVKDIVLHPEWAKRDMADGKFMKVIAERLKVHGLSAPAAHGLWGRDFDLNCPDENKRGEIIKAHSHFMRKASELGCLTYTVHLGERYPGYALEYLQKQVRRSIEELLACAEKNGIKIAMENMIYYDNSSELASLAGKYKHSFLGLCLDTGHAHVKEGLMNALKNMAPYLFTCHLQDNDGTDDQHWPPGYGGTINWKEFIPALKACPLLMNAETEAGPCENISMADSWKLFEKIWNV